MQYKDEQRVLGDDAITAQMCQIMAKMRTGRAASRAACSQELSKISLVRQANSKRVLPPPSADACFAAQWGVTLKMTPQQVKGVLARQNILPLETSTLKIGGKSTEQWRYETFSIYFEKGLVTAVQQYATEADPTPEATTATEPQSTPASSPSTNSATPPAPWTGSLRSRTVLYARPSTTAMYLTTVAQETRFYETDRANGWTRIVTETKYSGWMANTAAQVTPAISQPANSATPTLLPVANSNTPAAMAPIATNVAPIEPPAVSKYLFNAERYAKGTGCVSPVVTRNTWTVTSETFTATCSSGEAMSIQCEPDCRELKIADEPRAERKSRNQQGTECHAYRTLQSP